MVVGWGTALSGPLVADAVLLAVAPVADHGHPGARRAVVLLAALRLVGVLSEPVTWGRRTAAADDGPWPPRTSPSAWRSFDRRRAWPACHGLDPLTPTRSDG